VTINDNWLLYVTLSVIQRRYIEGSLFTSYKGASGGAVLMVSNTKKLRLMSDVLNLLSRQRQIRYNYHDAQKGITNINYVDTGRKE